MTLPTGFVYVQHKQGPRLHIAKSDWRERLGHWTLCNMLWSNGDLTEIGVHNGEDRPVCKSCTSTAEWVSIARRDL